MFVTCNFSFSTLLLLPVVVVVFALHGIAYWPRLFTSLYAAPWMGIDFDYHHDNYFIVVALVSFRLQTALGYQKKQKFEQLVLWQTWCWQNAICLSPQWGPDISMKLLREHLLLDWWYLYLMTANARALGILHSYRMTLHVWFAVSLLDVFWK